MKTVDGIDKILPVIVGQGLISIIFIGPQPSGDGWEFFLL